MSGIQSLALLLQWPWQCLIWSALFFKFPGGCCHSTCRDPRLSLSWGPDCYKWGSSQLLWDRVRLVVPWGHRLWNDLCQVTFFWWHFYQDNSQYSQLPGIQSFGVIQYTDQWLHPVLKKKKKTNKRNTFPTRYSTRIKLCRFNTVKPDKYLYSVVPVLFACRVI